MTLLSKSRADFNQVSINQFFDRNPIIKALLFSGTSFAPHAVTTRWTYTVPASRKAMIVVAENHVVRQTVASTASVVQSWSDINASSMQMAIAIIISNNIGDRADAIVGSQLILQAGDVLAGKTWDNSTGGTTILSNSCQAVEFDA